jgi:hypothetical protein
MKRTNIKSGQRKFIDGRYKDDVDKGAMSFLNISLPLKPRTQVIETIDDTPKQVIRQKQASRHYKNKLI